MQNPFSQPEAYTQIFFALPKVAAERAELYFDDIAVSVSGFEDAGEPAQWNMSILLREDVADDEIGRRLNVIAELFGISPPAYNSEKIAAQGWMDNYDDFPPMEVGRLFVHGSHVAGVPQGRIPICIDAGAAFGSGEHATTSGCLLALQQAVRSRRAGRLRVLDMGCGSGILGIAAAKLAPRADVLAVDVDPVSVRVAADNIRINRVARQVRALCANGYLAGELKQSGPYDLILSNILARPLMQFARHLKANLAPGGTTILSGLLTSQESMVLQAHRLQGLSLRQRVVRDGWSTLVIR